MKQVFENYMYKIHELDEPTDFSDQADKPTYAHYIVTGAEEDLYVFFETQEDGDVHMFIGMCIGDTGLITNLEDEKINTDVQQLVFEFLESEQSA